MAGEDYKINKRIKEELIPSLDPGFDQGNSYNSILVPFTTTRRSRGKRVPITASVILPYRVHYYEDLENEGLAADLLVTVRTLYDIDMGVVTGPPDLDPFGYVTASKETIKQFVDLYIEAGTDIPRGNIFWDRVIGPGAGAQVASYLMDNEAGDLYMDDL